MAARDEPKPANRPAPVEAALPDELVLRVGTAADATTKTGKRSVYELHGQAADSSQRLAEVARSLRRRIGKQPTGNSPRVVIVCRQEASYESFVEALEVLYTLGFERVTLANEDGKPYEPLSLTLAVNESPHAESKLPRANPVGPDQPWPEREFRPIVDLLGDGTVEYKKYVYHDPKSMRTRSRLRRVLASWVRDYMKRSLHADRGEELIDTPIMISTGSSTEFRHVRALLESCAEHRIWRFHFAVAGR